MFLKSGPKPPFCHIALVAGVFMSVGVKGHPKGSCVTQGSLSISEPHRNLCFISHVLYIAQAQSFLNDRNHQMRSCLIAFHFWGTAKQFWSRMGNAVILSRDSAVLTSFAFMTWPSWKFPLKDRSVCNIFTDLYKSHLHKLSFALFIYERKAKVQKEHSQRVLLSLKMEKKLKTNLRIILINKKEICCSVLELKINPWRESCQTQPFSSRYEWHARSLSLCHFTSVRDGKSLGFVNVHEMQDQDSNWLDTVFGAAGWTGPAKWSDFCELRKLAAFKLPQTSRNWKSALIWAMQG